MTDERTTIETHIRTSIERHLLLPDAGRVVVAVSGGADSLCLLGVLDALCGPGRYWSRVDLLVAHLNHGLRGDIARADAEWVAACAAELGLPCVVGARDVAAQARHSRRGIEDAARRARYAFLREVAHAQGATRICVGHTRDDQAETLILRWLRGSALTGMTGMRPLNGDIARPLLDLRRTQTQRYCALRGWTPRTDASNADRRYRRNRIRHELLPTLERFNPNLVNTLTRNAQLLADDDAYLEELAADAWNQLAHLASSEEVLLDAAQLAGLPLALRRRVLRRAAYLLQGDEPALEARHIALLELLIAAPTPAHAVHLPGEVYATLDARGKLVMRRSILARLDPTTTPPAPPEALSVPLPVPGRAVLPGSGWQVRAMLLDPAAGASPPGTEQPAPGASGAGRGLRPAAGTAADAGQAQLRAYLDADAAGTSLTVRAWRPGDRFRPLGMTGEKKVQDYFVDARVPRAERASIPLVWGPTHLLWIAGHRLDDRVKLTAATRRVLALRLEPAHLLESSPDLLTEVVEP